MKFSHSLTLKSILLFVLGLLCCIQANAQSIKGPNNACVGDPVFFTVDTYTAKDTLQWWISANGSSWEKYKLTVNKSLTVNEMPSHDLYISVTKMGVSHSSSSPSKKVKLQDDNCNSTICRQTSTGEFFFGSDCDPKSGKSGSKFHGEANGTNNIVEYFPSDVIIESRDGFEGTIYNGKELRSSGFFSDSVPGDEANYFFRFDPSKNNIRPFELKFKSYQGKSFSILMRYYIEWTCDIVNGEKKESSAMDIKLEGTYGSQVANQCLNINIKEVGGEFQNYNKCGTNQPEITIPAGRFQYGKLYVVDVIFDGIFITDQANNTLQPRLNLNGENCYHIAMDFISFENQQVCVTPRSVCAGNPITVSTAGFKYNTAFVWKKEVSPGRFDVIPSSEVTYDDKNKKTANIIIKNPGEYKYRVEDASNHNFYVEFTLIGEDCENILGPQITGEKDLCKEKNKALEQTYTLKETDALTWLTGTLSFKWSLFDPTGADVSSYLSYSNGKKNATITFPKEAKVSDDYNQKPYLLIMVPTENNIEIEEYIDTFEITLHRTPDLSGLTPYAKDICPSNPGKDTVAFLGFHNLGLDVAGYTYTWKGAQALRGDSAATLSINHSNYCSLKSNRKQSFTLTASNGGCEGKITGNITILAMDDPKEEGGPASTKSTVECENQAVEPVLPIVKDFCGNILTDPTQTITRDITKGNGTVTYTYVYKDCGDRTFTWVYTYTVKRTQGPREEGTAVQTESQVSCESEATEPTKLPIVVDACGNTLKNPTIETGGTFDGCSGTKTYTYTYTDEAGLKFVWTYTYHISMPATPALKVANSWPANKTNVNGCYSEIPAFPSNNDIKALFAAACGKSLTVSSEETTGTRTNDCDWSKTLKYTITDGCTSVDKTITYSGGDKTAPKMKTTMVWPSNVGNMNICFPTSDYPELRSDLQIKSMFDDCGEISVSHNDINSKTSDCDWSITRKYVIEDACHNKVDSSMTISGGDVSAPTYTGTIKSITQDGCNKNDLPAAATTITALESVTGLTFSDNCTNHSELKVTHSDSELSGSCAKTMTRTYTVTDKCNKSVSVEQTITLTVADAITITGTDHSTVDCPADAIAPHEAGIMPTVKDACGKDISANYTLKSSPTTSPCNGTMKYVYTFTDCANNTKDWTYTYTVDLPRLNITDGTATAVCAIDAKKPTAPTLKDACGRDVVPTYVDSTASIDIHGNGTVTHTFTYTDCENTKYTWKYIYTVTAATFQPIANEEKNIYCAADATTPATPNVTICGTPITFTAKGKTDNATTTGCGDIAYVYTYTVNGNDYEWKYTYHVSPEPFTIPTIKTTETVECVAEAVAPTTPTVTNSCGKTITPKLKSGYPTSLSGNAEEGQIIYVYNYTDCAGYSKDWTFTYNIKRTTKPTETGTPVATSKDVECESEATAPTQLPVVKDVCGKVLTAPAPIIGGTYADCEGTKTYTYIYKDYVDSTFTWTFTYNIKHKTNPSQVGTPVATSSSVECESEATAPSNLPVVKDVCGNTLTAPTPEISGTYTDCEGTKIYTYTYVDCAGLKYVWTYTYTIKRRTSPSESGTHVANSKTVNCLSEATEPTTLPVVKDVCGKTLDTPTPSVVDNYQNCEGTRTYNYLYKDCAGLEFTWSYVYTINHPDLTVPANDTVNIVCEKDTVRPTPANWTDKCGNSIPAVLNGSQVSTVDLTGNGFVTYNFIYEDCTGKTYPWQYVYKVSADTYTPKRNDTTSVHCLSEATQPTAPFVTICGERIDFNFKVKDDKTADGCGFVDYNYNYTVNGTEYNWTYVYKVSPLDFTIAKDKDTAYISCKGELKEPTLPVVKDACGRTLSPVSGPVISEVPNCDGFVTYKYTYNDCTGNHPHDWTFYYKIETPDFELPAFKGETIACRSQVNEPDPSLLPTVTDFCGNTLTPSASVRSDIPDCEGQVTYTYTYTDCANHSHDWVYTYTIEKKAPVIESTGIQNTQNITCINDTIAPATVPTAKNSCGEPVTPTYVKTEDWTSGKENCQGTITYTYTYTDCGLNSTWDFTYVLNDNVAPVIDCPADSAFKVHTSCDTTFTIQAPAVTDNCKTGSLYYTVNGGEETLYTAPFANTFNLGITTISWKAIDACGNTATCVRKYNVTDSTGITISCPTELDAIINSCDNLTWAEIRTRLNPSQIATAKRVDCKNNIDEEIQPELSYRVIAGPTIPVMGIGNLGGYTELTDESVFEYDNTYEIKWLFIKSGEDMETMKDSCFSNITLQDTSAPTAICSRMVNITLAPVSSCDTLYKLLKPEGVFEDNCGESDLLYLYKIGNGRFLPFEDDNTFIDLFNGDTTITWRVRDQYNQSESCEQHITVVDTVIPTTFCPNDTTINVTAGCEISVSLTPATAYDHCGIENIQYSTDNVTFTRFSGATLDTTLKVGVHTIYWRSTDIHGLISHVCSTKVSIIDTIVPTIACPSNIEISIDNGCETDVTFTPATADDNCQVEDIYYSFDNITFNKVTDADIIKNYPVSKNDVYWFSKDIYGNYSDTCVQTVTILDNRKFDINCPEWNNSESFIVETCGDLSWEQLKDSLDKMNMSASASYTDCNTNTVTVIDSINMEYTEKGANNWAPMLNDTKLYYNKDYTIRWIFTKAGENLVTLKDSCELPILLKDTTKPVFDCDNINPDSLVQVLDGVCEVEFSKIIFNEYEATDNCDGKVKGILSWSENIADTVTATTKFEVGKVYELKWIFRDKTGNQITCDQKLMLNSNIEPIFNCDSLKKTPIDTVLHDACEISASDLNINIPFALDACTADTIWGQPTRRSGEAFDGIYKVGRDTIDWIFVSIYSTDTANCEQYIYIKSDKKLDFDCDSLNKAVIDTVLHGVCEITAEGLNVPTPFAIDVCTLDTIWGVGARRSLAAMTDDYKVGRDTIDWTFISEYSTDTVICWQPVFIQSDIKPVFNCDSLHDATIDTVLHGVCEISAADLKVVTPFAIDFCTKDTVWGIGTRRSGEPVDGIYKVGRDTIDWKFISEFSTDTTYCEQFVFIQNDDMPTVDCDSLEKNPIHVVLHDTCVISASDLKVNTPFALTCFNDTIWGVGERTSGKAMDDNYEVGRDTIIWTFQNENTTTPAVCKQFVFIQSDKKPEVDCDTILPIHQVLNGVCSIDSATFNLQTPYALDACTRDTLWGLGRRTSGKTLGEDYTVGRDTIIWKFVSEYSTDTAYCEQPIFIQSDIEPIFDCDSLKNSPIDTVLHDACEISSSDLNINIPFAIDSCTRDTIYGQPTRRSGEAFDGIYKVGRDTIDWVFISEYSVDTARCEQYIYIKSDKKLDFDCDSLNKAVIDTVLHGVCEITAEGLNVPTPFAIDVCTLDTIWGVGARRSLAAMTDDYKVGRDTIDWTFISEYSTDTVICWQPVFIQSDIKPVFNCDSLHDATIDTVLHGVCEISAADLKVVTPFAIDFCTKDTVWGIGTRRSGEPVDGIYKVGRDTIDWKFISEFSTDTTYCEQFVFIQNDDMPTVDCDSLEKNPIHVVLHDTCVISASDLNVNIPYALTCFNDTIWGVGERTSGKAMDDNYEVGRDTIIWTFQNENTTTPAVCKQFVFIQSDKKPEVDCDTILPIHQVLNGVCSIDSATFNLQTPYALDACTRDTLWGLGRRTSGKTLGEDYTVGRDTIIWKFVSEYSTDTAYCEQPIFIQSDIEPIFDCDSLKNSPIDTVLHDACEISASDLNINIPFAIDSCTRDTIYGQPTRRSGEAFDGIYKVGRDTIDWVFISEYSVDTARCEQYIYIKSDKKLNFDCDSLNKAVIDTVLHGVCEITAEGLNVPTPFAIDVCTLDTIWGVGARRSLAAMTDDYKVGRDTIDWTFISEYSTDTVICWQPVFIQSDIKPVFDCDSLHKATIDTVLHGVCEISAADLKVVTPFAIDFCTKDTVWGIGTRRSGEPVDGIYKVGRDTIDWKFISEFSTDTTYCEQFVFIQNDDMPIVDCDSLEKNPIHVVLHDTCVISATDLNVNTPFALTCFNDTIWGVGERTSGKAMDDNYEVGRDTIIWTFQNENTTTPAVCKQFVFIQSDKKPEVDCDTILPIHQVLNGVCSIDSATFNLQTPYALDACTRDTLWGLGRRTSGKTLGEDYTVGRDTIIWKFVSEYSTDTAYCEQPIFIQSDIEPIFDCDSLKNSPIDTVLHDACEISASDLNINIPFAIDSCTRDTIYGQPTRRSGEAFDGIYKVGRDTIDWVFISEYSVDTARCEQYIYIKSDKKLDFDCDSLNKAVIDTVLHGVCEITAEGLNVPTPFAIDVCTLDTIWGVGARRSLAAMTDDYKVGHDTIDWTFISEYSTDTVICWQPVFIQSDIEPVFDCKNIHDTTLYLGLDQCEIPEGTVTLPTPIAKDACTDTDVPGVPTRMDGKAMTDAYPRDTTMITWKFTSIFSTAEKECPQNVIVVDTFPPMPDCEALDTITIQITESSTYFDSATYQEAVDAGLKIPSYEDVCDGTIIAVGEREDHQPLESVYPLGETIIHWIYTDKSGNSNSCSQVISVTDWIIDTLYCPGDLDGKVFACVDDIPAPYKTFDEFKRAGGSFSNEKKMDPSTFYYNDSITNDSCNMVVTRSYHVIDLKKNDISCEEVIYVKDTIAPTFDFVIADTVLSCADTIFDGKHITATDNCDPNPQVTIAEKSTRGDDPTKCDFYSYDITRTYTAKDRCGNETAETQMIQVRDTIAPTLTLPDNWDKYILATFKKKCMFDVPDLTEEVRGYAHDNCTSDENLKVVQVPSPGTQIKQSTDLKIYIYDVCGNVDSTKKFIKVQDGATIAHLTAHDVDSCVTEDRGVSLANENIRHASGQMEIIDEWDGTIMKIASTFVYEYYRGKEAKEENIMFSNNENTQWEKFQELISIYGSTDKAATELTKISQRSESGYYTMVAIDTTSGCTDTATIYVNILERPKVVLESANISVCEGNMVDIAPYVSCIDSMGADSVWTYWMKGDKKFDFEDSIAGLLKYEDNENTAVFYVENRCGSTSSLNSHLAFCVDPAHPMTTKDTLDYLNNDSTALEMLRANGLYSRDSITFDVHKRFKAEDIVIRTNPSNPARIWRGESIELSAYSKYPYEQLTWYKVVGEYDRANYNDATEHEEFEFNNMDDEQDSLITILLTDESSTIIEYPTDTTDYYVTVSDGVCPSASSNLTKVFVLDAIPTAFTPYDKEGLNDIFMERHHVVIYDRYGQKAFEGNNGWDGTHKGRMADPGVYYYQVLMGDGSLRTGSIEIINLR